MEVGAGVLEKEELRRFVVQSAPRTVLLTNTTAVHVSPRKRTKQRSSRRSATRKRNAARRRKRTRGRGGDRNARNHSDFGTLLLFLFIPSWMWNPPYCLDALDGYRSP